jgi:hypothetical protein
MSPERALVATRTAADEDAGTKDCDQPDDEAESAYELGVHITPADHYVGASIALPPYVNASKP